VLYLAASGLAFGANPLLNGRPVGGPFVNLVLLGYGIPAALAALLAYVTRDTRPREYSAAAAIAAVAWRSPISRSKSGPSITARC
jgi:uncharacterized membrane protein